MKNKDERVYAFIKAAHDAHTISIQTAASLLQDCGYEAIIADAKIEKALSYFKEEVARKEIIAWLQENKVSHLGISYRLDEKDAIKIMAYIIEELKRERMLSAQGGPIRAIFSGTLPKAAEEIKKEYKDLVTTFSGGESAGDTLLAMQVPPNNIPAEILQVSQYDDDRESFAKEIIDSGNYLNYYSRSGHNYPEYGSRQDSLLLRIEATEETALGKRPLMRAHVGPYSSGQKREEAVRQCAFWGQQLAQTGLLDILSLGTSQLTQSNFGENWYGKINGGGVPINSALEFAQIYDAARPLLLRTYAGTKNIPKLAQIYENTINNAWHALSLWWFNRLDNRGPYNLYTSLQQQIETIKYVAAVGKPYEANVSHHFAFRGADDITYIVTAYLAAKLGKKLGIKTFILQNMLNTPSSTWGIQDLAKSRSMLRLLRSLEDEQFKVLLQPRAGLDYFVPDLYQAKIQLAASTFLMDDIEANNYNSPEIMHVVSYSEASHLATPDIINESIRITLYSLQEFRKAKQRGLVDDMSKNADVAAREEKLVQGARELINFLEAHYPDLYTAAGFYKIFAAGFLPVPYLWNETEEFRHAINWKTKSISGSMTVVDEDGKSMQMEERLTKASDNMQDAENLLNKHL